MRRALPALICLAPALLAAADEDPPQRAASPLNQLLTRKEEETRSPIPAISLLPEGSILENVMLPRYDKDRRLASVLRCNRMVLETADIISGETVLIESFNSDRSQRARIDLAKAIFDQKKNLLRANQDVTITSDRLVAEGTALIYSLEKNRGFLTGPATTTLTQPPATAMKSASPALRATAFFGASLLPLIAAPPAAPTPEENARLQRDSASMAGQAAEANKAARTDLRSVLKSSGDANKAATDFLDQADLLAANDTANDTATGTVPEPKPLEVKPNPDATTIRCQGGMYFDSELSPTEGVLVYLKAVDVNDPRFTLKSAELKIFFEKKPEKKKAPDTKDKPPGASGAKETPPAPDKPAGNEAPASNAPGKNPANTVKESKKAAPGIGGLDFGDPRRIVATGAVVVDMKEQPGKEPIKASGAFFSYDLLTGDIILRGGYCWFIQGAKLMTAEESQLGIRINKNGEVSADHGKWRTEVVLPKQDN